MAEHLCVDCRIDPPKTVRKIVSGGSVLTWRCHTHTRTKQRRDKQARRFAYVARQYGLSPEQYVALLEFQDYRCAVCRIANGTSRALAVDHDHALAKLHGHPEDKACIECVRGLLCGIDNQQVLGRLGVNQLQNAINYKNDPPFQRMRRLGIV